MGALGGSTEWSVTEINQNLKNKGTSAGEVTWPGSLSSSVAGNVFIQNSHLQIGCLFEMDALALKVQVRRLHYK